MVYRYSSSAAAIQRPGSKEMTAVKEEDLPKLACALGAYILSQLPYGAKLAFPHEIGFGTANTSASIGIPNGFHAKDANGKDVTVETDGLFKENHAGDPYLTDKFPTDGAIAVQDMEEGGELKYWEMKGAYHTVTKALRIWYTYEVQTETSPTDPTPKTLTDENGKPKVAGTWLLIGYTGDGHG